MMKKFTTKKLMTLTAAFSLAAASLSAQVPTEAVQHTPGQINYQGRLVDPGGADYADGVYTFDIRLYRTLEGSRTALWGGTYSSYVKGGYFNIMLGDETGAPITVEPHPTYSHTELWKALWPNPATSEDEKNTLFLGVTPWHNEEAVEIPQDQRFELVPRQHLLTTPYAFRAQTAEYANQSIADFQVNERLMTSHLTVGEDAEEPMLKTYVTTDSSPRPAIQIGQPLLDNQVDIVANSLSLGATGETMQLTALAADISIQSLINQVRIEGATLHAEGQQGAMISGGSGTLALRGAKIQGRNTMEWSRPSSPNSYVKPFYANRYAVIVPAGSTAGSFTTNVSSLDYSAMIGGWEATQYHGEIAGDAPVRLKMVQTDDNRWRIELARDVQISSSRTYSIDVLFINKNMINDVR